MSAVGRICYSLWSRPDVLTFQDFDAVTVDLAAGEIRYEWRGEKGGLVLDQLSYLHAHVPGLVRIGTGPMPHRSAE